MRTGPKLEGRWWAMAPGGRLLVLVCLLVALVLGQGCRRQEVSHRRPGPRDASASKDPRETAALVAPRVQEASPSELAYDAQRHDALRAVLVALMRARRELLDLAHKGAGDPAFRRGWPDRREEYLASLGALRTQILEVDPLGRRSWGGRVASQLLTYLEVKLPNAVEESWSSRPQGALRTWSADFTLISGMLRRYLSGLNEHPRKGTSP